MKSAFQVTILGLAALIAASPFNCPPAATVTMTSGNGSPVPNAVSVTSTPRSRSTKTTDFMTISITNAYGTQLSLSFTSNAGGPSPIGNPSATVLPNASPTQYVLPTGWAGRIYIGPNTNPLGSKIEGSITGSPDIDITYVDGYSVPINCSSEGVPVSGCNIDLFKQSGIKCNNQVDGPVCLNSAQNIADGPAPPFFVACAGAAYTYPNDNEANTSNLRSNMVSCCIGTTCKAPSRQPPNTRIPNSRSAEPAPKKTIRHHHHWPRSSVHV